MIIRRIGREDTTTSLIVMLPAIAILACVFFWLFNIVHDLSRDDELRILVTDEIGTSRLQEWAVGILDAPPELDPDDYNNLQPFLPTDLRSLAGFGSIRYEDMSNDDPEDDHILLACGGGHFHYGLRIGRKHYTPPDDFSYERLADGVWFLHD